MPPSVAVLVANAALGIDCRIAVNLNYTMTSEVTNDCIAQCGIRHVLTSRRMIERFNLKLNAELVYLEDFKDKATLADKLAWVAMALAAIAASMAADHSCGCCSICPTGSPAIS